MNQFHEKVAMAAVPAVAAVAAPVTTAVALGAAVLAVVSAWTKSSLSHANGNCVEIADIADGHVAMRDSKNTSGPMLAIPPEEWKAFLGGVRNGEFDKFSVRAAASSSL
jgi:hypothetical protein